MMKDIPVHKMEDLAIALIPSETDEAFWDAFIINLRDEPITNVLVVSAGYGERDGEIRKTSKLRHFFEEIGPLQLYLIEPIDASLFDLTQEYWVSFTYDGYMYDKKYIFVTGSISSENFTLIPFLDKQGVMIR